MAFFPLTAATPLPCCHHMSFLCSLLRATRPLPTSLCTADGQWFFLCTLNLRMLLAHYGSYSAFPPNITAKASSSSSSLCEQEWSGGALTTVAAARQHLHLRLACCCGALPRHRPAAAGLQLCGDQLPALPSLYIVCACSLAMPACFDFCVRPNATCPYASRACTRPSTHPPTHPHAPAPTSAYSRC